MIPTTEKPITNGILISNYGNGIAVGLRGTPDFQTQQFNRFINYGAVSAHFSGQREEDGTPKGKGCATVGSLHDLGDNFAYFLSTNYDMQKALATEEFTRLVHSGRSKAYKGKPDAMEIHCGKVGEAVFLTFEREEFMSRHATSHEGDSFFSPLDED